MIYLLAALLAAAASAAATTRADLVAAVDLSPSLVLAHDRKGWLGLFTEGALIEDPVGAGQHVGHEAQVRFYETFIAPNEITFDVDYDVVVLGDDSPEHYHRVFRVATLTIGLGTSGGYTTQPLHLMYTLDGSVSRGGASPRVVALQAHWNVGTQRPASWAWADVLRTGLGAMAQFGRIGLHQGLAWTTRYTLSLGASLLSGNPGLVEELLREATAGAVALARLVDSGGAHPYPLSLPRSPCPGRDGGEGLEWLSLSGAGIVGFSNFTVYASGGGCVSAAFDVVLENCKGGGVVTRRGLGVFEARSGLITAARLAWEQDSPE